MPEPVNRQTLAQIKGCPNTDALNGACCTNNCQYRQTCTIKRIKLLIPAVTLSTPNPTPKKQKIQSIPGLAIGINHMTTDAFLNEHTGMFTSETLKN